MTSRITLPFCLLDQEDRHDQDLAVKLTNHYRMDVIIRACQFYYLILFSVKKKSNINVSICAGKSSKLLEVYWYKLKLSLSYSQRRRKIDNWGGGTYSYILVHRL